MTTLTHNQKSWLQSVILAGTSATTGLRTPTITRTRFIVGTTANTDFTANDANFECNVEITFDEQVTVTGTLQLTVTNNDQFRGWIW